MNIEDFYLLARSTNFRDFKSVVANEVDNVPQTVENTNEYIIVNKNDLPFNTTDKIKCPDCNSEDISRTSTSTWMCMDCGTHW